MTGNWLFSNLISNSRDFNVYGETCLISERKFVIWQGSFTKCSFDYFVSMNIDVDELSCEVNLFVNGALIGKMRFITRIVESPIKLNPEVLSKTFKKISYLMLIKIYNR